jgi:hypothetical protein
MVEFVDGLRVLQSNLRQERICIFIPDLYFSLALWRIGLSMDVPDAQTGAGQAEPAGDKDFPVVSAIPNSE